MSSSFYDQKIQMPERARSVLLNLRALFYQQQPEHRTMTAPFILTIAAHRKIRLMRKRRQQREGVPCVRRGHFGAIFPDEPRPLGGSARVQRELYGLVTRCQGGKPNVVPVLLRELVPWHATRGPTHRPNPEPFPPTSGASQLHNLNSHNASLSELGHNSEIVHTKVAVGPRSNARRLLIQANPGSSDCLPRADVLFICPVP